MSCPVRWDEIEREQAERTRAARTGAKAPERRPAHRLRRLIALTAVTSLALAIGAIALSRIWLDDPAAPPLQLEPASVSGFTLHSPVIDRRVGYVQVSGRMINRTDSALDRVEAIVDLLGDDRRTLATRSALVGRDRVEPGQVSGFRVQMPDVPQAVAYRVRYRILNGHGLD